MDKNTVIGLLLIGAVMVIFSIYNRPSQEQIEEQRRLRDSIAMAESLAQQEAERLTIQEGVIDSPHGDGQAVVDFFSVVAPAADTVTPDSVEATGEGTKGVVIEAVETESDSLSAFADSVMEPVVADRKVVLENEKVRLLIDTRGGSIASVQLKEFLHHTRDSLYLFDKPDESRFNLDLFNRHSVHLSTENERFTPIERDDGQCLTMRLEYTPQQYIDFIYTLPEDEYMMAFDIHVVGMQAGLHPESLTNFRLSWEQKIRQQERGRMFENRFSRIYYKYDRQDVERMSENKNARVELTEPVKWFAFKDQYFSSVIIGDQPFSNTLLDTKVLNDTTYLKEYEAEVWAPVTLSTDTDLVSTHFNYYFGPVHYNTLKAYDADLSKGDRLQLQEIVYLGYRWLSWVNKWFVIPIFDFFRSLGWGMGLIILILTLCVKLVTLPVTYKSFMSSAKMRVLRPQIKELEEKFPGKDQDAMMKRQQATMDLYKKVGVSPMSGCIPMLIQMPVLLALFFFFPSAIELRQQSFLWADDLSTYDALISWGGNIPIITRFLGNHISIFCLLMTTVNIVYTKYNMALTDTGQQTMPGMKQMPVFMSLFMFFILNSYPSGLNYYYFLSTLFTVGITFTMRKLVDEDKLLAQLEANKKKPKKKSGFMARLEEAQKQQEKLARERAKEAARRNYRR
jgi:YidC/Oxa1 family membrane protein insertase